MSWKKYGGLNTYETNENIVANSLVVNNFTIKDEYIGAFDVSGFVKVSGNITCLSTVESKNLSVYNTTILNNDVNIFGDTNIIGNTVQHGDIDLDGNILIRGNFSLERDFVIGNDMVAEANLFFNANKSVFFYGDEAGYLGINTNAPAYQLDISSEFPNIINVYSSQASTYNVYARNNNHRGILLKTDDEDSAAMQFYVDRPIDTQFFNYDALIQYNKTGVLLFDVSKNVRVEAELQAHNTNDYYAYLPTGYLQPKPTNRTAWFETDSFHNTSIQIGTDLSGIVMVGGTDPNNAAASYGSLGILNSGNYVPTMHIVNSKASNFYPTTLGINTYAPKTDDYIADINGAVSINNGRILVNGVDFEILKIGSNGNICIALGAPYEKRLETFGQTTALAYKQHIFYSADSGNSWTYKTLGTSSVETNPKFFTDILFDSTFIYVGCGNVILKRSVVEEDWTYISLADDFVSNQNPETYTSMTKYEYFSAGNQKIDNILYTDLSGTDKSNIYYTNLTNDSHGILMRYTFSQIKKIICHNNLVCILDKANTFSIYTLNVDSPYTMVETGIKNWLPEGGTILNFHSYKNHVLMVGIGYIWRMDLTTGLTVSNIISQQNGQIPLTFTDVYLFNESCAILIGDDLLYYTNTGFNWNAFSPIPESILNANGNFSLMKNATYKNICINNIDTFICSKTNASYGYDETARQIGNSTLFTCYMPNLFNMGSNIVLDILGSETISGNLFVNGGKIATSNPYFSLVNNHATTVDFARDASLVQIGNHINSNVILNHDVAVLHDSSLNGNLYVDRNTYLNSHLYVVDDTSLNSNLFVARDISGNKNLQIDGVAFVATSLGVGEHFADPRYTLEVSGNTNIKQNMYVDGDSSLNSNLFVARDISGNKNLQIDGVAFIANSLGVGENFADPRYALEVSGNTNIKQNMYVDGDSSLNSNLFVARDISGNKNLQIDGVAFIATSLGVGEHFADPRYTLEVSGNTNIKQNMYVDGDSSLNSNLFVARDISGNKNLQIDGAAFIYTSLGVGEHFADPRYTLEVSGNTNIKQHLFVDGDSSLNSNLFVARDISGNMNLQIDGVAFIATSLGVGENFADPRYALEVSGNTNIKQHLFVDGDSSLNSNLFVARDISGNKTLKIDGAAFIATSLGVGENFADPRYALEVSGNTHIKRHVYVDGDSSLNSNLFVARDISGNKTLKIDGAAFIATSLGVGEKFADSRYALEVSGNTHIKQHVYIDGDSSLNSNLFVARDISGNKTLKIDGAAFIATSLGVGENFADPRYALEVSGNTHIKQHVYVDGDSSLNSNLFVARDISGNKTLKIDGKTTLYDTLDVYKNAILRNELTVFADTSLNGNLTILRDISANQNLAVGRNAVIWGTLDVSRNTTLQNGLTVLADTSLNSNLFVARDISANQNLAVGRNAVIWGTLDVSRNTTLQNGLTVLADTSLNGNLTILRDISANQNLTVGRNAAIRGTLDVSRNTTLQNGLTVLADTSFNGNLTILRDISANQTLAVGGNAAIRGTLDVSKNATLQNGLTVIADTSLNSNLFVARDISANQTLSVGGNTAIRGTLDVSKNATLQNGLTVLADTSLNGNLTLGGNAAIRGTLDVSKNVTLQNGLTVLADTSLNSNLFVARDISTNQNLAVGGNTAIQGTLDVSKNATLQNGLTVIADTSLNSNLFVARDISANQNLAVGGNTAIQGTLDVSKNATLQNGLTVIADTSLNAHVTIAGDISANQNLAVGGNADISGTLYVFKNATLSNRLTVLGESKLKSIIADETITANADLNVRGMLNAYNGMTISRDVSFNNGIIVGEDISGNRDLKIEKNAYIGRNISVGADAFISRDVVVGRDISANKNVVVGENMGIKGGLDVSKNAVIWGGLSVDVNAQINGKLIVNADISANQNVRAEKNAYIGGDAVISRDFFAGRNAGISGQLDVSQTAVFWNNLSVAGTTSLNENLVVAGDISGNGKISLGGNMVVQGDASFNNRTFVNRLFASDSSMNKLFVYGDASFNADLKVGNNSTLNTVVVKSNAFINQNIYVLGDASFATIYSNKITGLDVSANSLYSGNVDASNISVRGNITVLENAQINGQISAGKLATGDITINSGSIVGGGVEDKLVLTGSAVANNGGNVFINGNLKCKNVDIDGDITMTGTTTLQNITVSEQTLTGVATMHDKLYVWGDASFANMVHVEYLDVSQNINAQNASFNHIGANTITANQFNGVLSGSVTAAQSVSATHGEFTTINVADTITGNNLAVNSDSSFNGNVYVEKELTVNSNLIVKGTISMGSMGSSGVTTLGATAINGNATITGNVIIENTEGTSSIFTVNTDSKFTKPAVFDDVINATTINVGASNVVLDNRGISLKTFGGNFGVHSSYIEGENADADIYIGTRRTSTTVPRNIYIGATDKNQRNNNNIIIGGIGDTIYVGAVDISYSSSVSSTTQTAQSSLIAGTTTVFGKNIFINAYDDSILVDGVTNYNQITTTAGAGIKIFKHNYNEEITNGTIPTYNDFNGYIIVSDDEKGYLFKAPESPNILYLNATNIATTTTGIATVVKSTTHTDRYDFTVIDIKPENLILSNVATVQQINSGLKIVSGGVATDTLSVGGVTPTTTINSSGATFTKPATFSDYVRLGANAAFSDASATVAMPLYINATGTSTNLAYINQTDASFGVPATFSKTANFRDTVNLGANAAFSNTSATVAMPLYINATGTSTNLAYINQTDASFGVTTTFSKPATFRDYVRLGANLSVSDASATIAMPFYINKTGTSTNLAYINQTDASFGVTTTFSKPATFRDYVRLGANLSVSDASATFAMPFYINATGTSTNLAYIGQTDASFGVPATFSKTANFRDTVNLGANAAFSNTSATVAMPLYINATGTSTNLAYISQTDASFGVTTTFSKPATFRDYVRLGANLSVSDASATMTMPFYINRSGTSANLAYIKQEEAGFSVPTTFSKPTVFQDYIALGANAAVSDASATLAMPLYINKTGTSTNLAYIKQTDASFGVATTFSKPVTFADYVKIGANAAFSDASATISMPLKVNSGANGENTFYVGVTDASFGIKTKFNNSVDFGTHASINSTNTTINTPVNINGNITVAPTAGINALEINSTDVNVRLRTTFASNATLSTGDLTITNGTLKVGNNCNLANDGTITATKTNTTSLYVNTNAFTVDTVNSIPTINTGSTTNVNINGTLKINSDVTTSGNVYLQNTTGTTKNMSVSDLNVELLRDTVVLKNTPLTVKNAQNDILLTINSEGFITQF